MKRFTFILSLILAFAGITASAQTYTVNKFATQDTRITSVDEITDGGLYAFREPGRNKYIKLSDLSNYKLNNDGTLSADDATDGLAVFKIHKRTKTTTEDGTATTKTVYSFETAFSGVYIQPVVDGPGYAGAAEATFEIRTTNVDNAGAAEGIFYIKNSENNMWFDMRAEEFVGWQGRDSNSKYEIIPVTVSDETVTYHHATHKMQFSDGTALTEYSAPFEAKYYVDGTELNITNPVASCNYSVALKNSSNVVSEGNTEFVFEITKNNSAPVTFSTADNKTWYKMFIFTNDGATPNATRTLKAVAEDNTYHVQSTPSAFSATDLHGYAAFNSAVWSFEESGLGVKVYNKGTGRYLKWQSNAAELVAAANATTFYITENTDATGGFSGFGLWTGNGNQYMNCSVTRKGVANARLGVWEHSNSKNNMGSRFIVEAIDVNADLVAVGVACMKTPIDVNPNYVTAGSTQADIARVVAALGTQIDAATETATLDELFASDEYQNALFGLITDVDPNAVYRISSINANTDKNKYASTTTIPVGKDGTLNAAYQLDNSMNRKVIRVPANDDFMAKLWQLEANTDGTYKIKSANIGSYWGQTSPIDMPVSKQYSGDFAIKPIKNATFTNGSTNDYTTMFQILQGGSTRINALSGPNGSDLGSYGGNHDADAGNYWQIEKVTSIPVTIGETGYASVAYPFAVQVPAGSNVKAYYASAAGNGFMTLAEIEDGLIPANTGAILVYTGETSFNLGITTTDKVIGGNKLEAATARRIGFEADENYLLAKDTDEEVKFLRAEITTVPANKAYLPAANVEGMYSMALAFDFNNPTTGINGVEQETKDVKYFDLNGRRVLYPVNGIFVTNTGKKVFIK